MFVVLYYYFCLTKCAAFVQNVQLAEEERYVNNEYFGDPLFYKTMEDMRQVCPNQRLCAQLYEPLSGLNGTSESSPTAWYNSLLDSQDEDYHLDNDSCCSPCSCSKDCTLWKKCCPDAKVKYRLINNNSEVQDSVSCMWPYVTRQQDKLVDLIGNSLPSIRYNVLSSCPRDTDPELADRCVNDVDTTFDSITFRSGEEPYMVYRNKYCAECNEAVNTTRLVLIIN